MTKGKERGFYENRLQNLTKIFPSRNKSPAMKW